MVHLRVIESEHRKVRRLVENLTLGKFTLINLTEKGVRVAKTVERKSIMEVSKQT